MKILNKIFNVLQDIGKSLWLPIAVLPAAGLILRLGQPDLLDMPFLADAGVAIFANLALLFSIGIAGGLSKDNNISAGLSGAVTFLIMNGAMLSISKENDMGTLGGIIAGLTAGYLYNKFYKTKLPVYLSFFGGRRFVPIISGFAALILAFIFGYIWPFINQGIQAFSVWVFESRQIGLFVYGLTNRLLLPTGLQHITEAIAYFVLGSYTNLQGVVFSGDINRFFALDPSAGMFMSGFFPIMIFGLPAAALAIYHTAKPKNKPLVLGLLLSGALTSALTGVTEPIEFPILFAAPLLFFIHAILMGVSYVVADLVGYKAGFTFSGGLIDLILSWGISTKAYMILILGPIFFATYYIIFISLIKLLNLKTPGREDDNKHTSHGTNVFSDMTLEERAQKYMEALGGRGNILVIDNCISRLRLQLKDINAINESKIKELGSKGLVKKDNGVQIIIGADVEFLANALRDIH